jgi:peptidoglycan lytic transglycosylase D
MMRKFSTSALATILLAACMRPSALSVQCAPMVPAETAAITQQGSPRSNGAARNGDSASGTVSPTMADSTTPAAAATPIRVIPIAAATDMTAVSPTEVARRAVEVFGDSASTASEAGGTAEPSWDIDVHSYESTDRVEHYVQLFSGPSKERIEDWLSRGTRYEPMIRAAMRAGGIPDDMYYLALIESGFDPNAYSRAAAVGMWQFMTSTARDMGMRVDWWVDERRDPVKSTVAAVRFIKDLDEQFGSLYLAAAAYNGGPGRVARGLTRYAGDLEGTTGDDLFFALAEKDYLRNETREYVPQLIAAALVAKEPARYGMKITPRPAFVYDSVRVAAATPLASIAKASGSSVSQLQELNPQILRGVTPPKDSFVVRIPAGAADSFAVAFDALPAADHVGLHTVISKKGQSMASIAHKASITSRQLAMYNPKAKRAHSGNLVPGQRILVPTKSVVAAARSVPDPSIEHYSSGRRTHIVKSGETVSGIAHHFHVSTSAILRANHLRKALIYPGQSLVVPR